MPKKECSFWKLSQQQRKIFYINYVHCGKILYAYFLMCISNCLSILRFCKLKSIQSNILVFIFCSYFSKSVSRYTWCYSVRGYIIFSMKRAMWSEHVAIISSDESSSSDSDAEVSNDFAGQQSNISTPMSQPVKVMTPEGILRGLELQSFVVWQKLFTDLLFVKSKNGQGFFSLLINFIQNSSSKVCHRDFLC